MQPEPAGPPLSAPWRTLVLVVLGGLIVGAVSSFLQGFSLQGLASLANSAGSWSLAAFLLCLPNRSPRRGAILGILALAAMVAGYSIATSVRGFPVSTRLWLFWGAAAVVVGPALGAGAAWVRGTEPGRIAAGAALIAGILVGEGAHGLVRIADTTSPAYWIVQILLGFAIVLVVSAGLRWLPPIAACAGITAIVAVAVFVAYGLDPISWFA